jgi:hypothetical protein
MGATNEMGAGRVWRIARFGKFTQLPGGLIFPHPHTRDLYIVIELHPE